MQTKQITVLLNQASLGNKQVLNDVYALLYADIKSIAGFQLNQLSSGQTITPTVLAHECYLKLYQTDHIPIENRRHFLNCLSRTMRLYLIDELRAKSSQKRQRQQVHSGMTECVGDEDISFDLLEIDRVLHQIEEIDGRLAEVLQHKLIFNLTFLEIAEVLEVSERQVMRIWKQAKALLMAILGIQEITDD
jgi:RNA polymerase sigma factor (TIGR02999 family)